MSPLPVSQPWLAGQPWDAGVIQLLPTPAGHAENWGGGKLLFAFFATF